MNRVVKIVRDRSIEFKPSVKSDRYKGIIEGIDDDYFIELTHIKPKGIFLSKRKTDKEVVNLININIFTFIEFLKSEYIRTKNRKLSLKIVKKENSNKISLFVYREQEALDIVEKLSKSK